MRRASKSTFLGAVVSVVTLLGASYVATASGFGSSASPSHYVLGDNTIWWTSIESNTTHKAVLQNYWTWVTEVEYDNKTNISAQETSGGPVRITSITSWEHLRRGQGVCHEIGHGVGFRDYASPTTGCMGGGTPNGGVLDSHEIAHLNACYVPSGWSC
jgi:hypothetical protein